MKHRSYMNNAVCKDGTISIQSKIHSMMHNTEFLLKGAR